MSTAHHCDTEGCDTWSRVPKKHGFLKITGQGGNALHFCSWDCVLKYSARFAPLETVPMD